MPASFVRFVRDFAPITIVTLALLAAWELAVVAFAIPPYLLPRPTAVAARIFEDWSLLWQHSLVTLNEVVVGFLLSVVVGVPLAVLIVASRVLDRILYPYLVASQAVPKIALAPLFVVWVGFGALPKVLMAFLISFFPVVVDTIVGLRSMDREMVHLVRAMGAQPVSSFMKARLPNALPNIFGGLKIAITLAVVGAVAAEFVGADAGLGYLLVVATGLLDTTLLFAALVVLSLMGIALFVVVARIESFTIPWHVSQEGHR